MTSIKFIGLIIAVTRVATALTGWLVSGSGGTHPAAAATASKPAAAAAPLTVLASVGTDPQRVPYRRPTEIPFPKDNPYTAEKALLGRILYFDPRLSGSNVMSCASCHNPSFGWGDGQALAVGHGMKVLKRRTPTVLNSAWGEIFFWDGRAATLEEQAKGPMSSPDEMNQTLDKLPAELAAVPGYPPLFERAFPGEGVTIATITKAIATFERTVVSGRAPFDRWVDGDERAIDDAAKRGFAIYNGKANCAACHKGWNFTDDSFHDIGLKTDDIGRLEFLPDVATMRHAFKTPTLRDIGRRAPYMHNGSVGDLDAVVRHYEDGFIRRPSLSADMKPFKLTDGERRDLIAFMETLTSPAATFPAPVLPK